MKKFLLRAPAEKKLQETLRPSIPPPTLPHCGLLLASRPSLPSFLPPHPPSWTGPAGVEGRSGGEVGDGREGRGGGEEGLSRCSFIPPPPHPPIRRVGQSHSPSSRPSAPRIRLLWPCKMDANDEGARRRLGFGGGRGGGDHTKSEQFVFPRCVTC